MKYNEVGSIGNSTPLNTEVLAYFRCIVDGILEER